MALMIPQALNLNYYANNFPATVPTGVTGFGTSVTAGASNAKGTAVSILTVTRDVHWLRVGFGGFNSASTNGSVLADILFDPAGGTAWQVLIPNLFAGNTQFPDLDSTTAIQGVRWFDFPIFIPAGSSIGCQAATANAATLAGEVVLMVAGGSANPGAAFAGSSVETIGIATADSGGTAHTAGASSVFSSWTNFGSTLARDAKGIIFAAMGEGDTAFSTNVYLFEFGVSGITIGNPIMFCVFSLETSSIFAVQSFNPIALPAGTQLQVRGKCAGASPQPIDVGAWALS